MNCLNFSDSAWSAFLDATLADQISSTNEKPSENKTMPKKDKKKETTTPHPTLKALGINRVDLDVIRCNLLTRYGGGGYYDKITGPFDDSNNGPYFTLESTEGEQKTIASYDQWADIYERIIYLKETQNIQLDPMLSSSDILSSSEIVSLNASILGLTPGHEEQIRSALTLQFPELRVLSRIKFLDRQGAYIDAFHTKNGSVIRIPNKRWENIRMALISASLQPGQFHSNPTNNYDWAFNTPEQLSRQFKAKQGPLPVPTVFAPYIAPSQNAPGLIDPLWQQIALQRLPAILMNKELDRDTKIVKIDQLMNDYLSYVESKERLEETMQSN